MEDQVGKMGADGFTPGTQRFAIGLFVGCLLLIAPKILSDPPPPPPKVPITGVAYQYDVGITACGPEMSNKDLVAALHPKKWKHPNPTKDPLCEMTITVLDPNNPKSKGVVVRAVDKCTKGCKMADISLSPAAFKALFKDSKVEAPQVTWDLNED